MSGRPVGGGTGGGVGGGGVVARRVLALAVLVSSWGLALASIVASSRSSVENDCRCAFMRA